MFRNIIDLRLVISAPSGAWGWPLPAFFLIQKDYLRRTRFSTLHTFKLLCGVSEDNWPRPLLFLSPSFWNHNKAPTLFEIEDPQTAFLTCNG